MTRRRLVLAGVLTNGCVLVIGCGGHQRSGAARACTGYPQPAHLPSGSISFTTQSLTKRQLCAKLGNPNAIRRLSRSREVWSYGPGSSFTVEGPKVISITAGGHTIATGQPQSCPNPRAFAQHLLRVAHEHPGSASPRVRGEIERLARHWTDHASYTCLSASFAIVVFRHAH
jgi:hypothetical protein